MASTDYPNWSDIDVRNPYRLIGRQVAASHMAELNDRCVVTVTAYLPNEADGPKILAYGPSGFYEMTVNRFFESRQEVEQRWQFKEPK